MATPATPEELPAFFQHDALRPSASRICNDIDLLVISRKSGGYSVSAVGACLFIEGTKVDEIEHDTECPKRVDKIHKLLKLWKQQCGSNGTWAKLIRCLVHLSDDGLMEGIRAYLLKEYQPLQGEMVCTLTMTTTTVQETSTDSASTSAMVPQQFSSSSSQQNSVEVPEEASTSAMVPQQFSSSSSQQNSVEVPEEGSTEAFNPSGAIQETSPPNPSTTHLVVSQGQCPQSITPIRPDSENPVSQSFRQSVRDMEEKFAALLVDARRELKSENVQNVDVQVYATQLSASLKENTPLFGEHMAEIMSETTLPQTIAFLSRIGAWDFLNFYLLDRFSQKFGNEILQQKVGSYSSEIAVFKKSTKLCDFLRVWAGRTQRGDLPDRKLLIAKLNKKWPDYTLADVADLEGYLASEFLLEHFIFHFSNAEPGCVTLMWLIPTSAAKVIREAIIKGSMNLKRMNIQELCIEGFVDFKVPDTTATSTESSVSLTLPEDGEYETLYRESISNPEKFWSELAVKYLKWGEPFKSVRDCNTKEGDIKWFTGGKLNVSVNCLDRHVEQDPDRPALIWERDEPAQHVKVTYKELLETTCRIANVLKENNIKKGDVVVIYMSPSPLAVASMFACARIGAVHSVVFSVFDSHVLRERLLDAKAKAVITAYSEHLGGKLLPLKANVDKAVFSTGVELVLVSMGAMKGVERRALISRTMDVNLEEAMMKQPKYCDPVPLDSEDPLFIMYTSGSSGKSKGIQHTQAGYLLYAAVTHKYVFNYDPGEVFCCVADLGWITGHTYVVYGPLCNGATTVLFGSTASYPDYDRYWEMIERLQVNHFYTTASAIRVLMKEGNKHVEDHDLSSLKTIGSVGEPLNVGAWNWYYEVVGKRRCLLVDTWWQTETGGIAISPWPAPQGSSLKPGFVMKPFFGVEPVLLDETGKELHGNDVIGYLCLKSPLPGMGRSVYGDHETFKKEYFHRFKDHPGLYFTCDIAHRDAEGDYQIVCRVGDAIRIEGVWLGFTEIESVMNMSDPRVMETSVVGYKPSTHHGSDTATDAAARTYAFVELKEGVRKDERRGIIDTMIEALKKGPYTVPERFIIIENQPQTYSGKIVRHLLRDLASEHATKLRGTRAEFKDATYDPEMEAIAMEDHLQTHGFYALRYR